ncbi:PKD domain-containing protein [Flavobacterium columnare]|uniref:PKD domain-containing protein n=2 Tax=Flavobacterium columnare TaxID=996 RepID=A0A437UDD2_9FLAO|nr:PKD domain-containing protein [Flavobacterium columnare]RVU91579.1 PKD domain-containing protein [Flavobacterium columnare]
MKFKQVVLFIILILTISCYQESFIPIEGDFNTQFVNADESVPVLIRIDNKLQGAETFQWEFEGGNPATSTVAKPGEILYNQPGTYKIKLTATNSDGESKIIEKTIVIKDALNAKFTYGVIQDNFSPVEVQISNLTTGQGITYNWQFEDGNPATFSGQHPPHVIFTTPGKHKISLTITNGFENQTIDGQVEVAPLLVSDFSWDVAVADTDYQAPVTLKMNNSSISATHYIWQANGGQINNQNLNNPTITFNTPGTYSISLNASNGKTNQSTTKNITIYPNTNLYIFNDVKLGINSAHQNNSYGAFFSTITQQTYSSNEVNVQNSGLIDIAFQGLNSTFNSNAFISPHQVQNYGFLALSNAQQTIFINSQELCNCGLNFSESQFNAMQNDSPLQPLLITSNLAGAQGFGKQLPRIVLFKTKDGRKGAIKIKNMITNGTNSYIVCDIKVQKQ